MSNKWLLITGLILILASLLTTMPQVFIEKEHPPNPALINKSSPYYGYRPPIVLLIKDDKGNHCKPVNYSCDFSNTELFVDDSIKITVLIIDYDSNNTLINYGEGWTNKTTWIHNITINDYNINQSLLFKVKDDNDFYYDNDCDGVYKIKYKISIK